MSIVIVRHHPVQVHRPGVGDDRGRDGHQPRNPRLAAILKTAPAFPDNLHLEFQGEIPGLHVAVDQIRVAAGILPCGFTHDRTVLHPPELRVAVPALEAHAVKERNVAVMIGEIQRVRFGKTHPGRRIGPADGRENGAVRDDVRPCQ